jgi:hypothetical protein
MTPLDQGWRKVAETAAMASSRRRSIVGPVIGPVIDNVLSPLVPLSGGNADQALVSDRPH